MEVETFKMTATTYEGLEDVLGRELMRMGADEVNTEPCSVTFTGDKYLLYEANYELRTALKIYKEILNFAFEAKKNFSKISNHTVGAKFLTSTRVSTLAFRQQTKRLTPGAHSR